MTITALPMNDPTGTSSPAFAAMQFRQAIGTLAQGGVSGRPLGALTGYIPSAVPAITADQTSRVITIPPLGAIMDVMTPVAAGPYFVTSDQNDTSLSYNTSHSTLDRIDSLYLVLNDKDVDNNAGNLKNGVFSYVAGVAGSGTRPTTGLPAQSFRLGDLSVPHNNGVPVFTPNKAFSVATGGLLPILDKGTRDAVITAPYPGMPIYRLDLLAVQINKNGATGDAAWDTYYPPNALEGFGGTPLFGTFDPTKPIRKLPARKVSNSDSSGYATPTLMPAGTTAVLSVDFGMNLIIGQTILVRTDVSSLTQVVCQIRNAASPYAALPNTAYDFNHTIWYQI